MVRALESPASELRDWTDAGAAAMLVGSGGVALPDSSTTGRCFIFSLNSSRGTNLPFLGIPFLGRRGLFQHRTDETVQRKHGESPICLL